VFHLRLRSPLRVRVFRLSTAALFNRRRILKPPPNIHRPAGPADESPNSFASSYSRAPCVRLAPRCRNLTAGLAPRCASHARNSRSVRQASGFAACAFEAFRLRLAGSVRLAPCLACLPDPAGLKLSPLSYQGRARAFAFVQFDELRLAPSLNLTGSGFRFRPPCDLACALSPSGRSRLAPQPALPRRDSPLSIGLSSSRVAGNVGFQIPTGRPTVRRMRLPHL
jgi:hypothetical protein